MVSRISAPQLSIFTSDPLEQIFARGVLDRNMSGLSSMFLTAERMARGANQDAYLGSLQQSNATAAMLQQLEEQFKYKKSLTDNARHLAIAGYAPSGLGEAGNALFGGNAAAADPTAAQLLAIEMQKAVGGGGGDGGGGGGDQLNYEVPIAPNGQLGVSVLKGRIKGGDPTKLIGDLNDRAAVIAELRKRGWKGSQADLVRAMKEYTESRNRPPS